MKNEFFVALMVGALTVAATTALISKKGKGRKVTEESAWYPTLTGYCGDFDVMSEECNDGMDNPTLLHNRIRV